MEIATNNIVFQLSSSKYNGNYIQQKRKKENSDDIAEKVNL